jgi:hypothetical protein
MRNRNYQAMRRQRATERRNYERTGVLFEPQRWSMVNLRGIAPYTIDRCEGTYTVEFDRTGRSLPISQHREVKVVAYDLRLPDGKSRRFSRLIDAKAYVRMLQEGGAA